MRRTWAIAVPAVLLYVVIGRATGGLTGLTRSVVTLPSNRVLDIGHVESTGLDGLDANAGGPDGATAVWEGFWEVTDGAYDLRLDSNSRSTWTIDGTLAAEARGSAIERTVSLAAGFHRIQIRYDIQLSQGRLDVAAARTGQPLKPLSASSLKPRLPRNPWLRRVTKTLHAIVGWVALLALAFAIWTSIREWRETSRVQRSSEPAVEIDRRSVWRRRALTWTVLAVILVHGALLRLDAITGRFGVVSSPSWVSALQARSWLPPDAIRPDSIVWEPGPLYPHIDGPPTHYRSDPYTYLDAARKMTKFYMPHVREPVFPFVTNLALRALDNQDVAVSFASTAWSLLAIWSTYLLGAAVWSRPVGLIAALGLSLDYHVIALASLGWRDDAYMAAFTICAYLLLRYWRAGHAEPLPAYRVGRWRVDALYVGAAVLGLAAGFTMLTRLMAISFFVGGVGWIALGHRTAWRRQLTGAAIVALVAVVTSAPYFINCWRTFGDPFLTFNVHAPIYSAAEGQVGFKGSTASYIRDKITKRPYETLDTVVRGVTSYPFMNKWQGLNRWLSGIGTWTMIASLAGLAMFAGYAWGRLLLVVVLTSLLPFSLTWTVDPDFRFTVYTYPLFLVAAAVVCSVAARVPYALLTSRPIGVLARWRGFALGPSVAAIGMALVVWWFVSRVSPSLVFAEALKGGADVSMTAGGRGEAFGQGWADLVVAGNVSSRLATHEAELRVRLPEERDYPATLRMDPFPRPLGNELVRLPRVDVLLNRIPIATIDVGWTPERVGSYPIVLPKAAVRRGANRLVLRLVPPASASSDPASAPRPGLTDGDALALWYLRVHAAR